MSSIALVIFLVDCTLRIRRRRMRSWPPAMRQSTFPVSNPSRKVVRPLSSSSPSGMAPVVRIVSSTAGVVRPEVLDELGGESVHLAHRDRVGPALGPGVDHQHLLLHRHRLVLGLLEQLRQPVAAVELGLGHPVELRAEGGERLELAELRQVELERARHLLHRLDLGGAAHPAHRVADVDGRPDARVEQVGLQEDLAVGDGDDVGRDVGRDVAGLGLDDRQRGQRAAAERVGELGRPLQQARVQVEDVAGVRLAPRWAPEQQGDGPVGLRLLGQVVVDDRARARRSPSSAGPWRSRRTAPGTCRERGPRPRRPPRRCTRAPGGPPGWPRSAPPRSSSGRWRRKCTSRPGRPG